MSDDQQRRAAPVTPAERKSPADRAREVQDLQRRSEASPIQRPAKALPSRPVVTAPNVARVAEAQKVAEKLGPGKTTASEQAVYAKLQADPVALFGGPGAKIEITGNPWKVIDFSAFVPMLFTTSRSLESYQPQVPQNAVQTEQGLLFQPSLAPRDGGEPVQTRAVLVDGGGALIGAECRNAGELSKLVESSPGVFSAIQTSAFSDGGKGAKLRDVRPGRDSAYVVSVARGGEVKSVPVNNFGLPGRANLIVADYHLDRFEAA